MLSGLAAFVTELRSCGIPVTVSEHLDGLRALDVVGLRRRDDVRQALRATLVKDQQHFAAFDLAFEVFFGVDAARPDEGVLESAPDGRVDGSQQSEAGPRSLQTIDRGRLRELVGQVLVQDNDVWLGLLADELVSRYGEVEPERPVAGTSAVFRTMAAVDVPTLYAQTLAGIDAPGDGEAGWTSQLMRDRVRARRDRLQQALEASVRQRLVSGRGREAVAATARRVVPDQVDLTTASTAELSALEPLLDHLGVKMAAKIAKLFSKRRSERLNFRATARRSMQFGGSPVELVMRRGKPPKPDVWVLADVSGSMARFSLFTLQLVFAMRAGFSRLRCFAFQDRIDDITHLLAGSTSAHDVRGRILHEASTVWLDGSSDYGNSFLQLWRTSRHQITRRTVILIVGDARNNHHLTNSWILQRMNTVAAGIYWLNPERRSAWNSGDSVIDEYGKFCTQVVPCRSVADVKHFIDQFE